MLIISKFWCISCQAYSTTQENENRGRIHRRYRRSHLVTSDGFTFCSGLEHFTA